MVFADAVINEIPIMASNELTVVVEHLKRIAELSKDSGAHALHKRALLEMYFAAAPEILTIEADVKPVLVGDLVSEWVLPENANLQHRILYLHGGSWMAGSSSSHRPLIARLAKLTGYPILALNYRLAPEFPFPAGLEDAIHAFQWLQHNGPTGKSEAEKLFIMGDSAGGNLSLATLLALKQGQKPMPDAVAVLSPATDLDYSRDSAQSRADLDPILSAKALPFIAANYVQEQSSYTDPLVSPVFGDLSGLPPMLVQTGESEILWDDSQRFVEAAKAQGCDITFSSWPDMPHVFQGYAPLLPEAVQAQAELAEFIKKF